MDNKGRVLAYCREGCMNSEPTRKYRTDNLITRWLAGVIAQERKRGSCCLYVTRNGRYELEFAL